MEHSILNNPLVLGLVFASFAEQIRGLSKHDKKRFFKLVRKLIDPMSTEEEKLLCIDNMLEMLSCDNTLSEAQEKLIGDHYR